MEIPTRPEYARSAKMAAALRENFLYSEKRARDCVFVAVESTLRNSKSEPTLATLTRGSLHAARIHATRIHYDLLNSEIVTRTVFNAMLRAGVLLGPGRQPISAGLRAYAARVSALTPAFRDDTESFLIEYLIGALGDIGPSDHLALAHVLFRHFDATIPMADLEDRLVTLLGAMSDRIELCGNGTYAIRPKCTLMEAVGST
jgi:hypothetical protein